MMMMAVLDPAAPNSASGIRNSQCINMQKRCIKCFVSFRRMQYLNHVISLLMSQYLRSASLCQFQCASFHALSLQLAELYS
uniref:Uncharacterized protein n=1 Tax=Malurus cyaneus samueli TaxID=2593467 RepID=A0A8C5TNU9_9PASS